MTRDPRTLLAACLLLLLGGFLGSRLGSTGQRSRAAAVLNPALAQDDRQVDRERARGLAEAIERLTRAVEALDSRLLAAPAALRQPVATQPGSAADMGEILGELRTLNRNLQAQGGVLGAPSSRSPAPRKVDRGVAFGFTQPLKLLQPGDQSQALRAAEDELKSRHFLWTRDDVLASYGRPDSISTGQKQNSSWMYRLSDTEVERESFTFSFHLDRVTNVSYHYRFRGPDGD